MLSNVSDFIEDIANFLAEEQMHKGYSALNTTRSAISAYHDSVEGKPVGSHDLIKDLMESAKKDKPPKVRYSATWDVNRVLQYIRHLGPNTGLEVKDLTHKLAMLMSLVSATRGHELKALSLDNMVTGPDQVTFMITQRTKTKLSKLVFHRYEQSENLDVVACLDAYLVATQTWRNSQEQKSQLFLAINSPHEPVVPCTIARWLKIVMESAGIDTEIYKAHSTRSAATSKAKFKGLSTAQIIRAANWTNASTFQKYYNKDIQMEKTDQDEFANAVLS